MRFINQLFISGLSLFTLAGWVRYADTGSLTIDNNYPSYPAGILISLLVMASIGLLSWGFVKLYQKSAEPGFSLASLRITGILAIILLLICPPVLSNDVFSYLFYGEFIRNGSDPYSYSVLRHAVQNEYYAYVSPLYKESPNVYGPASLVTFILPATVSNIWLSLLIFKAIYLLFCVLLIIRAARYPRLSVLLFASVFLLEIVGQMHNDIVAIYFVFAALDAAYQKKSGWAAIFSLLTLLSKVIYFPFLCIVGVLLIQNDFKKFITWSVILVSGVIGWYLIHPSSLIGPFLAGNSSVASGSWADLVYQIFNTLGYDASYKYYILFFQAIALTGCLLIAFIFFKNNKLKWSYIPLMLSLFIILYFTFFIHRSFPWYAVCILPLMLVNRHMDVKWLTTGIGLSILEGLTHQFVPGSITAVFIIAATTLFALSSLALWTWVCIRRTLREEVMSDSIDTAFATYFRFSGTRSLIGIFIPRYRQGR